MHVSEIRKRRGGSARTNIIIQSYMSFLKTIMFLLMFFVRLVFTYIYTEGKRLPRKENVHKQCVSCYNLRCNLLLLE